MAIPHRHRKVAGTYFVTSRTWESRALFVQEPICQVFVQVLLQYRVEKVYQLHAFVLMPDHFHALLTPSPDVTLERAMQHIKGGSAYRMGKSLGLRFPVWQRGFSDHRIRNAEDYEIHWHYIDQNPVKSKLASAAGEYAWSSACGKFGLDLPPQRLKPPLPAPPSGTAKAVP